MARQQLSTRFCFFFLVCFRRTGTRVRFLPTADEAPNIFYFGLTRDKSSVLRTAHDAATYFTLGSKKQTFRSGTATGSPVGFRRPPLDLIRHLVCSRLQRLSSGLSPDTSPSVFSRPGFRSSSFEGFHHTALHGFGVGEKGNMEGTDNANRRLYPGGALCTIYYGFPRFLVFARFSISLEFVFN